MALTAAAVCIQGYHLGADDAAIYVPGIKQAADPSLYPFGAQFFQQHAHLTIFPLLAGGAARLAHVPKDWAILGWHVAGVFLLMLAGWRLASACFETSAARWSAVAMLAAVLTVPVAGTALAIGDPYVTSRTLSTPATILAIACFVSGRRRQAAGWWLFTLLVHPQMGAYAGAFLGCLAWATRRAAAREEAPVPALAFPAVAPFLPPLQPAQGNAREALLSRTYFFVSQWAWYEWIGIFAPLAILAWLSQAEPRGVKPPFRTLARALTGFGLMFTAAGIVLATSPRFENYTRLQPMRAFHLVYVIFFVLMGGLVGEYVLRRHVRRWLGLYLPLAGALLAVQMGAYPASAHMEWPGTGGGNRWSEAFLWIRANAPKDAVFGIDPEYMSRPGEDMHGFRAVAERSVLADAVKDSGAVSLFPSLADEWKAEVRSEEGWSRFKAEDFQKLAREYPVTWIVTGAPGPVGLVCPYRNQAVAVCRLGAR